MIDASQGEVVSSLRAASRLVGRRRPLPIGVFGAGYVLLVLVVGAVSGWIWHSIVTLPSYLTSDDGSVQMTERAQGQIFMLDAVFVVLGMAVGVGLGLAAWQLFRRLGWPVAVIAAGGGLLAGAVCWGSASCRGRAISLAGWPQRYRVRRFRSIFSCTPPRRCSCGRWVPSSR